MIFLLILLTFFNHPKPFLSLQTTIFFLIKFVLFCFVLFPFSFEYGQFISFVFMCCSILCDVSPSRPNNECHCFTSLIFFILQCDSMRCFFLCSMLSDSDCTTFFSRTNFQNPLYCHSHDVHVHATISVSWGPFDSSTYRIHTMAVKNLVSFITHKRFDSHMCIWNLVLAEYFEFLVSLCLLFFFSFLK